MAGARLRNVILQAERAGIVFRGHGATKAGRHPSLESLMSDTVLPDLNTLFEQLGLASTDDDIEAFVAAAEPIPSSTELADAALWSDAQAGFLREAIARDGAWALVVDELDTRLRAD